MSQDYFDASMGTIWIQPDGPNSEVQYLGCHDLGDIVEPRGEVTKRYGPDRASVGRWEVKLTSQGVPGNVTTTITTYTPKQRDYLQKLANKTAICGFPIYGHQSLCGRRDVFLAYDAGTLVKNARIQQRTKRNVAMREGAEPSEMVFDLVADFPIVEYWPLRMAKLTTTEPRDATSITLCGEERCQGPCGDAEELGDEFAVGTYAGTAASANVQGSVDAGATIAAMAAQPFGNDEHISAMACYHSGRDTVRHLAARGVTDAGAAAEIGYTDNFGANWTLVDIGSTNGEFMPWNGCLYAFDEYHIWACTDDGTGTAGNIYFSKDGGLTWALQGSGGDALNCIFMVDYNVGVCVGDANTILLTTNGGSSWTAITGPSAQAAVDCLGVHPFDRYRWQIVYEDGELWYTHDGGDTWTQRALPAPAGMTSLDRLNSVHYLDNYNGVIAGLYSISAAKWGVLFRTMNGGANWEAYTTEAAFDTGAIGLAQALMAEPNLAYAVGDLEASVAAIYKLSL